MNLVVFPFEGGFCWLGWVGLGRFGQSLVWLGFFWSDQDKNILEFKFSAFNSSSFQSFLHSIPSCLCFSGKLSHVMQTNLCSGY